MRISSLLVLLLVFVSVSSSTSSPAVVLEASLDAGATWVPKGTISLQSRKFSKADGAMSWDASAIKKLTTTAAGYYRVRAYLTSTDADSAVVITLPTCALSSAAFKERFVLMLAEDGEGAVSRVQGIQWAGTGGPNEMFATDCALEVPATSKVFVSVLPPSKAAAAPQHMTLQAQQQQQKRERAAAAGANGNSGEGDEENKSFLQKYWQYMLFFFVGWSLLNAVIAPPQQEGGGGGGGN
eukprot:PhM_4_TR5724/c0_g1_i1/m.90476